MTDPFKCKVAGKENRETPFSKHFYFIGHHLFLFLRSSIALCRNWKLFHSLWMLFYISCFVKDYWCSTGQERKQRIYEKLLFYSSSELERERIKIGESPQIWKDKLNLGEMFLRRDGGQMYGSGRKFKSKKSFIREWRLSGETGSCKLQSMGGICLISFLHVPFLMGKVMEWAWKRESSESLVFCLTLLGVQDSIHLQLSGAYWCVVFAVWSSEGLWELQSTFSFLSPALWILRLA